MTNESHIYVCVVREDHYVEVPNAQLPEEIAGPALGRICNLDLSEEPDTQAEALGMITCDYIDWVFTLLESTLTQGVDRFQQVPDEIPEGYPGMLIITNEALFCEGVCSDSECSSGDEA